ncbi:MAG: LysR family transcription regulator protein [Comamonadaceae bacterium]|nr:MAG: LysR family transcription regulator protein [Comamonadaceae bacterium]
MSRSFDPVQLGSIEMFCKAAELQGFTAAALAMGVTAAAVSRSVGRLEERLGAKLFTRTTRQMRLTEEGHAYFEQCRQALAQIENAERAISGNLAEPSGVLRVSMPTTYGHHRVLPLLAQFMERYPKIKLEVDLSNRNIDFVEDGCDLAIRGGTPNDSRLVARKLEDASFGIFAAPQYLALRGTPQTPEQLQEHECIAFVLPSTGRCLPWLLRQNGQDLDWMVQGRVSVQGDVLGCLSYAAGGGGLLQAYHFVAQRHLESGRLVEVMQAFGGRSRPFSILYPHNRHLSAKVRALVQFLVGQLASK